MFLCNTDPLRTDTVSLGSDFVEDDAARARAEPELVALRRPPLRGGGCEPDVWCLR